MSAEKMPRKLWEIDMTQNDLILNVNYGQSLDRGFTEDCSPLIKGFEVLLSCCSFFFLFFKLLNTGVKLKTKVRK